MTAPQALPLLETRDLRVRFGNGGGPPAVDGVSYRVLPGETLAIVGESGSGKTVSCRALMALLPAAAQVTGSVKFEGAELIGLPEKEMRRRRGADLAMVFQNPARSLNPTMRVGDQIAEAVRAHGRSNRHAARRRAFELLELLELGPSERRFRAYPHELSGGTQQRVMIAIALAGDPKLLVADEPTTSLDVATQAQILELLMRLKEQRGMALIIVSHDLRLAAAYADRVLVMYAGRSVEYGPARRLFERPRMPYTDSLLEAFQRRGGAARAAHAVASGAHPRGSASRGCPFQARCPRARDTCTTAIPPFVEHSRGHWWACFYPCDN